MLISYLFSCTVQYFYRADLLTECRLTGDLFFSIPTSVRRVALGVD